MIEIYTMTVVELRFQGRSLRLNLSSQSIIANQIIEQHFHLSGQDFYLTKNGRLCNNINEFNCVSSQDGDRFDVNLRMRGGIDFQHREGSKIGSGGILSESQAALERKERLRKLALETIDITKDPYFMRNHLGTFECKLCLTLHPNEGNYLSHTQGKRHQSNLGKRAAMEAKNAPARALAAAKEVATVKTIKIGRPGYKVSGNNVVYFL